MLKVLAWVQRWLNFSPHTVLVQLFYIHLTMDYFILVIKMHLTMTIFTWL
ncbi:hypothetical protein N184_32785 [Sinorhizobium sp. GL28]|nr:hypothetical protein N184_32785 [Sinorhizobium sp. GL28]